ncbi:hypothetical protein A2U01_0107651, partial [Trifolium medium]|nr:hypothetical protein [Trifolium medium]
RDGREGEDLRGSVASYGRKENGGGGGSLQCYGSDLEGV